MPKNNKQVFGDEKGSLRPGQRQMKDELSATDQMIFGETVTRFSQRQMRGELSATDQMILGSKIPVRDERKKTAD